MRKPHTDKHAVKVNQQQSYVPARFIDVIDANVRLATVSGVFQVRKDNPHPYAYRGNWLLMFIVGGINGNQCENV